MRWQGLVGAVLLLQLHLASLSWGAGRSTRDVLNDFAVKNRAKSKACQSGSCPAVECDDPKGWYLRGSDWGCCSNYEGCCRLASLLCYTHDVICRCCDYGFFCGPLCQKEPSCFPTTTTPTPATTPTTAALQQRMMGDDGRQTNQNSTSSHVNSTANGEEERISPKFRGKAALLGDKDAVDEKTGEKTDEMLEEKSDEKSDEMSEEKTYADEGSGEV